MRARLIAIAILILLIGGPISLYWYSVRSNQSSLRIDSSLPLPFHIQMSGTFNYKYLPLADKLLSYEYDCQIFCDIDSLPPATYNLILTSTGFEKEEQAVVMNRGEKVVRNIDFRRELRFIPFEDIGASNVTIEDDAIIETFKSQNNTGSISGIRRIGEKLYIEIMDTDEYSIGVIQDGRYSQIYSQKNIGTSERHLDITGTVYIIPGTATDVIIFLLTGETYPIPHVEKILLARKEGDSIVIRTPDSIARYAGMEAIENPRFTDFIDINERYRLGYIDASDTKKLLLQNYPLGKGILVLLDRSHGHAVVLRTPIEMLGFVRFGESVGLIDRDNKRFILDNILP